VYVKLKDGTSFVAKWHACIRKCFHFMKQTEVARCRLEKWAENGRWAVRHKAKAERAYTAYRAKKYGKKK